MWTVDFESIFHELSRLRRRKHAASAQSFLLRDMTTILLDCALRPEECFRMRWEDVRDGALHIVDGETENARRAKPMTQRVAAQLDMRQTDATSE